MLACPGEDNFLGVGEGHRSRLEACPQVPEAYQGVRPAEVVRAFLGVESLAGEVHSLLEEVVLDQEGMGDLQVQEVDSGIRLGEDDFRAWGHDPVMRAVLAQAGVPAGDDLEEV